MKQNPEVPIRSGATPGWASDWPDVEELRRKKGSLGVNLHDYDFSDVPEDQIKACLHYEYARESRNLLKAVEEIRTQINEAISKKKDGNQAPFKIRAKITPFTKSEEEYDKWFMMFLAGQTKFPRNGWQDLEEGERQLLKSFPDEAVQLHNNATVKEHPVFIAESVQEDGELANLTLATWERTSTPMSYRRMPRDRRRQLLLSGFMMVNLLHSPDEIVARFKKWLLKWHPNANKPAPEKRGRISSRDRLNALGAMRLRFYCRTLKEAQKLISPTRNQRGMSYSDRTAWNRACARATDYFREVLDLPEGDLPIHFSEGWQK